MQNHQPTNPHHYYYCYYYHSFTLYQNKHPHTIINSQLAQLWLTLIHSLTPNSLPNPKTPSLSLSLWFHGTQRLTPSLQPSVDSVEKSPPKKTKTKKIYFLCWLFPILPRIGWLGFIGLCSPPPYSSSSSSFSVSFLFSTLAPVTLIRFTGKFLRFRRPIFHGSVTFQWLNFKLLSPLVCLIRKLGLVIL